jgi:hypothetical protein
MTAVVLREGVPVGMVALYDIADGRAEYGRILVDDACRRRRVGLAISGCIVAFGFAVLKLGASTRTARRGTQRFSACSINWDSSDRRMASRRVRSGRRETGSRPRCLVGIARVQRF